MKYLEEFLSYSRKLGKDKKLIQHSGGNNSIKHNEKMFIKASGKTFKNFDKNFLSIIDLNTSNQIMMEGFSSDKPSMEKGFHHTIPSKIIFHLHCLDTIIISSIDQLELLEREIRNHAKIDTHRFNYINPGAPLEEEIKKIKGFKSEGIILLKNHGVIIYSQSLKGIESILNVLTTSTKQVFKALGLKSNNKFIKKIKSSNGNFFEYELLELTYNDIVKFKKKVFFPDQQVFLKDLICWEKKSNLSFNKISNNKKIFFSDDKKILVEKNFVNVFDIFWAYLYIISVVFKSNSSKLFTISTENIETLLDTPEEKHRMNLL